MVRFESRFQPLPAHMGVRLAQTPSPLVPPHQAITPAQRNMAIALGAAETGFGVVSTWVGVRAGMREKGVFSALGYVVAAGGALFTAVNLLGTLGMMARTDAA